MMHVGDILSTVGDIMSTMGVILSTVGDTQCRGGISRVLWGCSVPWGIPYFVI